MVIDACVSPLHIRSAHNISSNDSQCKPTDGDHLRDFGGELLHRHSSKLDRIHRQGALVGERVGEELTVVVQHWRLAIDGFKRDMDTFGTYDENLVHLVFSVYGREARESLSQNAGECFTQI